MKCMQMEEHSIGLDDGVVVLLLSVWRCDAKTFCNSRSFCKTKEPDFECIEEFLLDLHQAFQRFLSTTYYYRYLLLTVNNTTVNGFEYSYSLNVPSLLIDHFTTKI